MIKFDHLGYEELIQGVAIVADFGKSVSKISLWSREGRLLDRQTRANTPCEADGIRRLDTEGIGDWLVAALAKYAAEPVEAIVPVGHGAGVAALAGDKLIFAPFDYEQPIPDAVLADYRRERDPFAETGSPALPAGLNIGSQLFWQERLHPDALRRATLLPWTQYWAWFLSGIRRSEVTSLGCHSDLWSPARGNYSALALRRGWADRFALIAQAGAAIGTLRPELAERTGLSPAVRIHAGLHDSNAALFAARAFPEIGGADATVLSTGTWFVAMRSPREPVDPATLPEDRDCLVNIDVEGKPVPSARFMGGREIELLGVRIDLPGIAGAAEALSAGAMVLPGQVPGCGPFPQGAGGWHHEPSDPATRQAAVALYAALMADASLDLIGARDVLLVEGRFAASEIFTRALAALRPDTHVFVADGEADVSFGALRLVLPRIAPPTTLCPVAPLGGDLAAYRRRWRAEIEAFA